MSTRSYVNVAHGPRSLFLKSSGAAWYVCFQLLSRAHFWCKCLGSRARGERTCQSHRRKWGYRKNTNTQTTRAITALIYHFPLKTHITSTLDDCQHNMKAAIAKSPFHNEKKREVNGESTTYPRKDVKAMRYNNAKYRSLLMANNFVWSAAYSLCHQNCE